jgi:hypothetical protein
VRGVRAVYLAYLLFIVAGVAYCTVLGLVGR